MRNVTYTGNEYLTSDGCVEAIGVPTSEECCPPAPCQIAACTIMCNFIGLLPNGPMWDRAKAQGMDKYSDGWCAPYCDTGEKCASLVDYAAYSGYRLYNLLQGPLWSALRESSPYTASETLDSWLSRLGWENPWETVCRDARLGLSPLDCAGDPQLGACDDNFSPVFIPTLPKPLNDAVNRAIAISLYRSQMSPIKNLCGINWVIEPLGAELRTPDVIPEHTCADALQWVLCNKSDMLDGAPGKECSKSRPPKVQAYYDMPSLTFDSATGNCRATGPGVTRIWPAMLAAEYIALSMLPEKYCRNPIVRCAAIST